MIDEKNLYSYDSQALRTLKLLEYHHQKLAELLKNRPIDAQPLSVSSSVTLPASDVSSLHAILESPRSTKSQEAQATNQIPPSIQVGHRELSSSIASNLASARGIPSARQRRGNQSTAQLSPQNAEGRVVNPRRRSKLGEYDAKMSKQVEDDRTTKFQTPRLSLSRAHATDTSPDLGLGPSLSAPQHLAGANPTHDDTFSRFYATFGNLISTLSAPLAFAGLPLSPEPLPPSPVKKANARPSSPTSSRVGADPDLTRIFSRAALHAVRDGTGGLGGAESFYVVPTTGGTMSYAGMLSHGQLGSNLTEDDDTEFVDASETPQPLSPSSQRRPLGSSGRGRGSSGKTVEELEVENESLRAVTVDFADRLRMFELGAQRSSIALHASIRAISSPTGSVSHGGKIPPVPNQANMAKALEDKIRAMEDEVKAVKKENKRLTKENQKYISVIERYRERWEMLKVGARERVKAGPNDL